MSDMAVEYERFPFSADMFFRMGDLGFFADDERPVELLDGEIVVMPTPSPEHQYVVRKLSTIFHRLFFDRAAIDVNGPLRVSDSSVPLPDLTLLALRDHDYKHATPGAEDTLLAVEVSVSTLSYDRGRKLRAYARAGVTEVWIVNVGERRVERYADPSGSAYATVEHVLPNAQIAARAFPQDAIEVGEFMP